MPNVDKMRAFMEDCGKERFSDNEMQMMKQFCGSEEMPDMEKMKELMEQCGCHVD